MTGQQYIVPIKVGSRIFAPRPFTTLLTIVLIALLIALGRWQLRRAEEKRVLFDAFAAGSGSPRSDRCTTPNVRRYSHVEAGGHYDTARQILIDNMVDAAGAGYYVITPFALEGGGWVLVNRGWVPLGASRAERPAIEVAGDARRIRGRADNMPSRRHSNGRTRRLGAAVSRRRAFPTHADLAQLLGRVRIGLPPRIWCCSIPVSPTAIVRNWAPPGFPPLRHIGYAVQWFALALALFVIYIVTNFAAR